MKVAVCVCTCGRPAALDKLLNALCLAQLDIPDGEAEIVIVDNSADGQARAVYERYRRRLPVAVYFVEENVRGISFARNRAVAEAFERRAQFVAFIDDDDVPLPDWLVKLVEKQRETKADIITGVWRSPDDVQVPKYLSELRIFTGRDFDQLTRYGIPNCATCNVLIARTAIELAAAEDGPFRADFAFTGGGDTDFFIRAHRAGATVVQAGSSVVIKYPGDDRLTIAGVLRHAIRVGSCRMILAAEHFPTEQYRKMRRQSAKKLIKCLTRLSPFSSAKTLATVYDLAVCVGALYASFGGKYRYYRRSS